MSPYRVPSPRPDLEVSSRGPRLTGWRALVHRVKRAVLWLRVGSAIESRRNQRRSFLATAFRTARDIQRRLDAAERVGSKQEALRALKQEALRALVAREGGPWPKPCATCGMVDRHSYACDSEELRTLGFIRGPALDFRKGSP